MSSLLLFIALMSSIVVDVTLSDGQQLQGNLSALSNDGVTIVTNDGQKQTFARSGVNGIRFPKPTARPNAPKVIVQLVDQSLIPSASVIVADGNAQIDAGKSTEWKADVKAIQSIRWLLPNEKTDDQWNEIASNAGSDDLLVIRRQSLDYLKGVVLAVQTESVQFEYSGNKIPAPLARVAGIILAKREGEQPTARLRLMTHGGGVWMLQNATQNGNQLDVTTAAGAKAKLQLDKIAAVVYPQLGAVFLTDLEPTSIEIKPLVASTVLADSLKRLNAPRIDQSFDGEPIMIASSKQPKGHQSFKRGLAIQSRTEMVYRLAGKYQRFMGTAGLALGSPSQAEVELRLYSDDREIFRQAIREKEEPITVDVDISKARRLKLVVDYGANVDIGNRLHLGDARLVK